MYDINLTNRLKIDKMDIAARQESTPALKARQASTQGNERSWGPDPMMERWRTAAQCAEGP